MNFLNFDFEDINDQKSNLFGKKNLTFDPVNFLRKEMLAENPFFIHIII